MNASPITSWENAEAYFTFANSPSALAIILAASVIVTFGVVILSVVHETKTYIDYK
ncbi:MAG: hypothetical protein ACTIM4_15130 [Marinomonas sp.]